MQVTYYGKNLPEGVMGELSLSLGHLPCKLETHESSFFCVAKSRAIAIPVDLDSQVNNLFLKSHNIVQKTAMNWRLTARNAARRDSVLAASRDYRNIIERLQDIVSALEDRLRPLVQAELSVLVDVLHRPELLFPENTDARRKCESGGFICKLIKHTKQLLEENEEKLCIKVLQTLREMMTKDRGYGEKVLCFILLSRQGLAIKLKWDGGLEIHCSSGILTKGTFYFLKLIIWS